MAERAREFDFAARNLGLDVLRGLAILMVIVHHADEQLIPEFAGFASSAGGFVFWRLKNFGWSGVDLFFVLSGFLISGLLLNEYDRHGRIRYGLFYLKRSFKILPSYLALLVALSLLGIVDVSWREAPIFLLFLQNYLAPIVIGPTWSLAVEEHFYLLLPLCLSVTAWLALRFRRRALSFTPWLGAGVLVTCLLLRWQRAFQGPLENEFMMSHFRFDAMFAGVLTQYVWRSHHGWIDWVQQRRLLLLPVACCLLLPSAFWPRSNPWMFSLGLSGLSLGYALVLVLVLKIEWPRLNDNLALRLLRGIGRCSYNIYLWHFFVAALGLPGYLPLQRAIAANIANTGLASLLQILVFMIAAVSLGWWMTELVEKPAMRLRQRLLTAPPFAAGQPSNRPSRHVL